MRERKKRYTNNNAVTKEFSRIPIPQRFFIRLKTCAYRKARQNKHQPVRIQSALCKIECEGNSHGLKNAFVTEQILVLTRTEVKRSITHKQLLLYKLVTVAHQILRTIKSLIDSKHIFVFILFAINELIFKRF